MLNQDNIKCHCGKYLHYKNKEIERLVNMIVMERGETIPVTEVGTGNTYLVPRHYIALHGLKAKDLSKLGFKLF